jgi:hypothetical protein
MRVKMNIAVDQAAFKITRKVAAERRARVIKIVEGFLGLRPPSLTTEVISEERVAVSHVGARSAGQRRRLGWPEAG